MAPAAETFEHDAQPGLLAATFDRIARAAGRFLLPDRSQSPHNILQSMLEDPSVAGNPAAESYVHRFGCMPPVIDLTHETADDLRARADDMRLSAEGLYGEHRIAAMESADREGDYLRAAAAIIDRQ